MSQSVLLSRFSLLAVSAALALSAGALALAQNAVVDPAKNDLPNPNPRVVKNWAPLPDGRTWGSTAGIDIGPDGHVWVSYAIDSESNPTRHPDWKTGVRIGSTTEDKVTAFIPPHPTGNPYGAVGEGVAVGADGNVYGAEGPNSRGTAEGGVTKYLKR